jgi:hypothetical protein
VVVIVNTNLLTTHMCHDLTMHAHLHLHPSLLQ